MTVPDAEAVDKVKAALTGDPSERQKHESYWGTKRADTLLDDGGICIAISGPKGAGKTFMAGQTAESQFVKARAHGDLTVLALDVEAGMRPIRHRHDVEFKSITSWPEYVKFVDKIVAAPELPWGCIFTDNVTELAELCMAHLMTGKQDPTYAEWRRLTQEMTAQVRKLRDVARNRGIVTIFNVWDKVDADENGHINKIGLDLSPRLMGRFAGAVDMIGWLEVLDDEPPNTRVLHLAGNSKVTAKFRKDPFGPEADIPWDLYWKGPDDSPLNALFDTLLGGQPWDKTKYLPPAGAKPSFIRRATPAVEPAPKN